MVGDGLPPGVHESVGCSTGPFQWCQADTFFPWLVDGGEGELIEEKDSRLSRFCEEGRDGSWNG